MLNLTFRHDGHITKRTFRFKEIDVSANKLLDQVDAVVGTIYIKKTAFYAEGICPDEITVKVEW